MKRTFLIGLSWSNHITNGFMNYYCTFENRGFRASDVRDIQKRCEEEIFNVHGEKATAVVLHISELETEE